MTLVTRMNPASDAVPITPSDTEMFPVSRGLYVGQDGDVTVKFHQEGEPVTFAFLAPGVIHPLAVVAVLATGTDAEGILAVY